MLFGKKEGSILIDEALDMFTSAEKKVAEGIKLNEEAIAAANTKLAEEKAKVEALEKETETKNADLVAKNARGKKFVERMQAFFGELPAEEATEEEAADAVIATKNTEE